LFEHEALFFKCFPVMCRLLRAFPQFVLSSKKIVDNAQITGNEISGPLIGYDSYSHYFFLILTNFWLEKVDLENKRIITINNEFF
jgi:hypothetical protein